MKRRQGGLKGRRSPEGGPRPNPCTRRGYELGASLRNFDRLRYVSKVLASRVSTNTMKIPQNSTGLAGDDAQSGVGIKDGETRAAAEQKNT